MGFLDGWKNGARFSTNQAPGGETVETKTWLTGDDAQRRFEASPDTIKKALDAVSQEHSVCGSGLMLGVDVERYPSERVTFLNVKCQGCKAEQRVRVDEVSGFTSVSSIDPPAKKPSLKTMLELATKVSNARYSPSPPNWKFDWEGAEYEAQNRKYAEDVQKLLPQDSSRMRPKPATITRITIDRLTIVRAAPAGEDEV